MKKLPAFFSTLTFFLLLASPVLANKCGVNIGPNYSQVNQVTQLTKPGGWIVSLGSPGNSSNFESLFGKNLNVVIRAYNGGKKFTNEQALGWVATLGKLDSKGQVIYFMPWNEPNHDLECGGQRCTSSEVANYVQFLKNQLNEAGLLNTKVILLSPMIDKLHPRFEEFKSIYYLTNGSPINEYDQFVSGPCSAPSPTQNNCLYDQIGIPPSYYALETGVAGTCSPPCYRDDELVQMLNESWKYWGPDGNFKMFAIFSYDPHRPGAWDIFRVLSVKNFYSTNCQPGAVASGSFDKAKFDAWFVKYQSQVVPCDGHGYAPSKEFCTATGETIDLNTIPGINFDCSKESGDVDSRPHQCELCHQTGFFCTACATGFQVNDEVKYKKGEHYGENVCLSKPWGGTIAIDASAVSIPFVGYKGDEDEQNYLADYFVGTVEYPEKIKDYNRYWLDWVNHAGVWRKLSPMAYQDQLKEQMVSRAVNSKSNPGQEGSLHNYQLEYAGQLCWDFPFAADAFLAILKRLDLEGKFWNLFEPVFRVFNIEPPDFVDWLRERSHYCIFATNRVQKEAYEIFYKEIKNFNKFLPNFLKISVSYRPPAGGIWLGKTYSLTDMTNHQPPNPDEENYQKDWLEWKEEENGKWFSLWTVVPMFSREDTPGLISVQVGTKEGDRYDANPQTPIEKVPHVARLHEASYQTQKMLLPYTASLIQAKQSQNQSDVIIAQPGTGCPQADPLPIPQCEVLAISDPNPNDTLCCEDISINLQANEKFINQYWPSCELEGECKKAWNYNFNPFCWDPINGDKFNCSPAETKAICNDSSWWGRCCKWEGSCNDEVTKPVSRRVGITLRHPYLNTIWNQTTNPETQGVFNIFRPAEIPPFIDMDAQSSEKVSYSYTSGSVEPSEGNFYFNHLGGIQLAKDWVVGTLGHTAKAMAPEELCGPPGPAPESCPKDERFEPPVTGLCCDYGKHTGNPYYIDVGDSMCSRDYCHKESFGPCNVPFGECYYCNTNVCKRNDGVGGCAAICNWQCCQ